MIVTHSEDRKFWCLGYFENSGGSYRSMITTTFFLKENGAVDDRYAHDFKSDGYYRIEQLETDSGRAYLMFHSMRGCNYCFTESVELLRFNGYELEQLCEKAIESRDWAYKFEYYTDSKTLTLEYESDDLSGGCNCAWEYDESNFDSEEAPIANHQCFYTYEFNGSTFMLTEFKMSTKPEKEDE